ncbi:helix-turn-helix transcriptional regulator [Lysobacter sp. 2RAF19]
MIQDQQNEIERIRKMADSVDCLLEDDFRLLAGATKSTVEAWRKRGQGPAYIRLGNRVLYPREAVSEYLRSITRERNTATVSLL